MARMMRKWTGRLFAALAAAAFAVFAFEYAGEDVSAEASGAAREFMFAGGGVTNRLAGTEADMAAVRALYSEEAAAATASPVFPHVAPPPRNGFNPLADLAVFDSDALLYYAFSSNIVNNVVLDESTNGCDGVATGCSWLQAGRFNGGALEFFGNSSEVNAGTGLDFPSWSQYSVSLWFLHDGGGDMGPQYGHKMLDKTSFYHDWHIALMPTGASAGSIGLSMYEGGTHLGMGDPSSYYMDGEWHHVAVVRDGARGEFWVDGELVVETNAMFSVYSQSALCVGNSYSADYYQQKGWSGVIDEVRVFDRPLATNEVVSLYLEGTMSPVAMMDYDGDGMPNGWELENGLDPTDPSDAYADADYVHPWHRSQQSRHRRRRRSGRGGAGAGNESPRIRRLSRAATIRGRIYEHGVERAWMEPRPGRVRALRNPGELQPLRAHHHGGPHEPVAAALRLVESRRPRRMERGRPCGGAET